MTRALMEKLSLSYAEAEEFRNERGLELPGGTKSPGMEALVGTASALADEITRHYHYWDTRRNEHGERVTPVGKVVLVGGSANLKGLVEYIAGRVQAPTEIGDVWQRIVRFDEYVPPIDQQAEYTIAWTEEALRRMERIPVFARGVAKTAIHRYAIEKGHTIISNSVVDAAVGHILPKGAMEAMKQIGRAHV